MRKTTGPPAWYMMPEPPTNLPMTYCRPLMAGDFVRTRTGHPTPASGVIAYIHNGVARLGKHHKIPTRDLVWCYVEWDGKGWNEVRIL